MKVFTLNMGQVYCLEDIPETHQEILMSCHHQGRCDDDVREAAPFFEVDDQEALKKHLKGYGAWDDEELEDEQDNLERLLWLMAGDIQEQGEAYLGE